MGDISGFWSDENAPIFHWFNLITNLVLQISGLLFP